MNTTDPDAGEGEDNSPRPLLDAIRQYVLQEHQPLGSPLSESALARRFGVSRTPVREVLKQLQSEGIVDIRPRVGTFIREPSPRELAELFDVKEVLEGLAARLLAGRGRVHQVDLLEENVRLSFDAIEREDPERYAHLVLEFHTLIIAGADAVKLSDHYRLLMNQLAYQRTVLRTFAAAPERMLISIREHERILQCIQTKDGYGSEIAMREHVQSASRAALTNR